MMIYPLIDKTRTYDVSFISPGYHTTISVDVGPSQIRETMVTGYHIENTKYGTIRTKMVKIIDTQTLNLIRVDIENDPEDETIRLSDNIKQSKYRPFTRFDIPFIGDVIYNEFGVDYKEDFLPLSILLSGSSIMLPISYRVSINDGSFGITDMRSLYPVKKQFHESYMNKIKEFILALSGIVAKTKIPKDIVSYYYIDNFNIKERIVDVKKRRYYDNLYQPYMHYGFMDRAEEHLLARCKYNVKMEEVYRYFY